MHYRFSVIFSDIEFKGFYHIIARPDIDDVTYDGRKKIRHLRMLTVKSHHAVKILSSASAGAEHSVTIEDVETKAAKRE